MKDMAKIKDLAKQILSACDEYVDEEEGTASEVGGEPKESSSSGMGEKSLKLSLSKYKG